MAEFSKLVLTGYGQALLAKMIVGTGNIDFTKICSSSTQYTEAQLASLTSLSGVQQTSLVSKVTRTNEVAIKVESAFSNAELKTGYYMRTLGLYAVDPDRGEILYAATVETSGNCYMPQYNGVTVTGAYIQLITTVGNASSVSLDVDPGAYATIGDIQALEKEIADLKAFVGYTEDDIYGVEVDFVNKKFTRLAGAVNRTPGAAFDGINAFGGRRRCNLTNAGEVVAYYGDAGFTTTGKLTQTVVVGEGDAAVTYNAGTIVQTMVEQPKFYYKVVPLVTEKREKGSIMRKVRYYVSDTPKVGFKLHPDFIVNGAENDYSYHSAFEGSLWDASASVYIMDDAQVADFAADMLSSIANAKPISGKTQNLTRANTRLLAKKRGFGWEQLTVQAATATEILMLIEYASFNTQSSIGAGAVYKSDDITNNMAENTGATITLGNASGSVVNANGIQIVSYRGEENFWGNIWKWVDGIHRHVIANRNIVYIADHDFTDDTSAAPYADAGISACTKEGYVSAFCYSEEYDWLFVAGETNGNSSLPVGDYFWNHQPNVWTVVMLGAGWNDSVGAGAFCWGFGSVSAYRNRSISGRLVYHKNTAVAA